MKRVNKLIGRASEKRTQFNQLELDERKFSGEVIFVEESEKMNSARLGVLWTGQSIQKRLRVVKLAAAYKII